MWGCVFSVYQFPLWWLREYIYFVLLSPSYRKYELLPIVCLSVFWFLLTNIKKSNCGNKQVHQVWMSIKRNKAVYFNLIFWSFVSYTNSRLCNKNQFCSTNSALFNGNQMSFINKIETSHFCRAKLSFVDKSEFCVQINTVMHMQKMSEAIDSMLFLDWFL